MSGLSLALQSGSILFREGLEAMLILSALAAFLQRADAGRGIRALYLGAGAALVASLMAAVVFALFSDGGHNDQMEAVVMSVAALLMLYMSGWLFLKQDPRAFQAELRRSASAAISAGTSLSLGLIAFFAVFREGAETVLFLHALAQSSGGWNGALLAGLIGALALLALLFVAMQWFAVRLPLRPVFLFTSALLFIMGLKFIGAALQELQEMQWVAMTPVQMPGWLVNLGVNASVEAMAVQAVVALAAVVSTLLAARNRQAPALQGAPAE